MFIELAHHAHRHVESSGGSSWGTFPQWVTMAIGLVAAVIAVRTYVGNVWQTKVKVARLVYCEVKTRRELDKGEDAASLGGSSVDIKFGEELISAPTTNADGYETTLALEDLAAFTFVIHNNSDEPIGGVQFWVTPAKVKPKEIREFVWIGTLNPKDSRRCHVCIARSWSKATMSDSRVNLFFTDSSGVTWFRDETDPPIETHPAHEATPRFVTG